MALKGTQIRTLRDALFDAFPGEGLLKDLVLYGLNIRIDKVVPPGALNDRIRDLIIWTEAQGRTDELLSAALNDAPKNSGLREIAQQLGMDGGAGQFESIVRHQLPFIDGEKFREDMIRCEQAVCRVEVDWTGKDEPQGTGFLIAEDLLITNHHVMEPFLLNQLSSTRVALHFDYKMHEGKPLKGSKYKLASEWLVSQSTEENLDYALLRLAEPAGRGTVGNNPNASIRGYLNPTNRVPAEGEPLMIIQHPKGNPLRFALGSVKCLTPPAAKQYLTYDVNTDDGSSGSPCFMSDWSLVALHHWGGKHNNRGILFSAIVEELSSKNVHLGD